MRKLSPSEWCIVSSLYKAGSQKALDYESVLVREDAVVQVSDSKRHFNAAFRLFFSDDSARRSVLTTCSGIPDQRILYDFMMLKWYLTTGRPCFLDYRGNSAPLKYWKPARQVVFEVVRDSIQSHASVAPLVDRIGTLKKFASQFRYIRILAVGDNLCFLLNRAPSPPFWGGEMHELVKEEERHIQCWIGYGEIQCVDGWISGIEQLGLESPRIIVITPKVR